MLESPLIWAMVLAFVVAALLAGSWLMTAAGRKAAPDVAPMFGDRPAAGAATASPRSAAPALGHVRSWGYQLQDLDLDHAAAGPHDLLVVDYTLDGTEATRLSPGQIERLKHKPDGSRRIVLAYVSIGEAESYRPYWQPSWAQTKPLWLLRENPQWPQNFAVCFWDPGWQRIMFGRKDAYLDRIQALGFDGFYLDKCDVYEDLQTHEKRLAATRPSIERDMVDYVAALSRHLKAQAPGFLVVMQNAEGLLAHPDLLAAIDGVAKEELLFGVDAAEKRNGADEVAFSKTCLDRAKRAGKPVFVVEYLNARDKIRQASTTIADFGYTLYVSPKDRALSRLNYDGQSV